MQSKTFVLRGLLVVACLALGPRVARADEKADAEARRYYDEGQTQYSMGEFEKAITAYKKAYELSKRPTLLFNIGQAYRLKMDFKWAKFFYESFLRAMPEAPNRTEVEARIQEVTEALAKQEQTQRPPNGTVPPGGEPTDSGPTTTTTTTTTTMGSGERTKLPSPEDAARAGQGSEEPGHELADRSSRPGKPIYKKWWFWGGIGAVAAGTAAFFILSSGGSSSPNTHFPATDVSF